MTILVVDDERNIADSIAGTLIAELNTDAEVRVCYGSQQAKEFSATHYIDIIVCDIDMPKCNGISLCKSLFVIVSRSENYFFSPGTAIFPMRMRR